MFLTSFLLSNIREAFRDLYDMSWHPNPLRPSMRVITYLTLVRDYSKRGFRYTPNNVQNLRAYRISFWCYDSIRLPAFASLIYNFNGGSNGLNNLLILRIHLYFFQSPMHYNCFHLSKIYKRNFFFIYAMWNCFPWICFIFWESCICRCPMVQVLHVP